MLKLVTALLSILKSSERIGPSPPPMVTWGNEDSGEVIVLDIPYDVYVLNVLFYNSAIESCIASQLGLSTGSVRFIDFQISAVITTKYYFKVFLPSLPSTTSSETITDNFNKIKNFFTHCSDDYICCPAVPNSQLLTCLINQGLPVTNIYYNEQCL